MPSDAGGEHRRLTPSGSIGSMAICSARPITTVSRSSGPIPAASRLAGRSGGSSWPRVFQSIASPRWVKKSRCSLIREITGLPFGPNIAGGVDETPVLAHHAQYRTPLLAGGPRRWVGRHPRMQSVIGTKESIAIGYYPNPRAAREPHTRGQWVGELAVRTRIVCVCPSFRVTRAAPC